ncbi:hypothetical protein PISMIDRAFT_17551 [Pisolithus microcarpus 441]|uniref:Heterokaryon incompatibility domain-containing protein n=1 Tax=Pisolithus microcarpus 441 TaxID=765257 RepID=A0A0C9Z233_9AGAM|nr:hypothetical protein PISMIDRAFT_17551 [Pisolithus microcarpus 441]
MEDSKESLWVRPSPIGYIAMAVSLLGQGDQEGALCIFDLAFHDCELGDNRFLLLLKLIFMFESGNQEDAIIRIELLSARANNDSNNDATYLYTQVLAVMYMKKGNYGHAIPLLEHMKNIAPKIFGWSFDGLDIISQQHLCETLYAEGHTAEAAEILLYILKTSDEDAQESKANADQIADFIQKCIMMLGRVGDEASSSSKHDDAITQYSAALSFCPPSPADLLIKQSTAQAARGLWEDALQDVNESHNPKIKQLLKDYISPSETIATINSISRKILKHCLLVIIDVTTGQLCDSPERMDIFKADLSFKELVSSMTREVDKEQILEAVTSFFRYITFSHVWQGNEPLLQQVGAVKSVWNLPKTVLNEKLHNFCKETRGLGYRWAWLDSCCINKATTL